MWYMYILAIHANAYANLCRIFASCFCVRIEMCTQIISFNPPMNVCYRCKLLTVKFHGIDKSHNYYFNETKYSGNTDFSNPFKTNWLIYYSCADLKRLSIYNGINTISWFMHTLNILYNIHIPMVYYTMHANKQV